MEKVYMQENFMIKIQIGNIILQTFIKWRIKFWSITVLLSSLKHLYYLFWRNCFKFNFRVIEYQCLRLENRSLDFVAGKSNDLIQKISGKFNYCEKTMSQICKIIKKKTVNFSKIRSRQLKISNPNMHNLTHQSIRSFYKLHNYKKKQRNIQKQHRQQIRT